MAEANEPGHARLLLHQATDPAGVLENVWLELEGGELALRAGDRPPVPVGAGVLGAVMRRYGRPLADDSLAHGPELRLASGERLALLRHLARFDVIAKDYVVYEAPGQPPLAELATAVSAALCFLVRSSSRDTG
jgi:hypothetical protein